MSDCLVALVQQHTLLPCPPPLLRLAARRPGAAAAPHHHSSRPRPAARQARRSRAAAGQLPVCAQGLRGRKGGAVRHSLQPVRQGAEAHGAEPRSGSGDAAAERTAQRLLQRECRQHWGGCRGSSIEAAREWGCSSQPAQRDAGYSTHGSSGSSRRRRVCPCGKQQSWICTAKICNSIIWAKSAAKICICSCSGRATRRAAVITECKCYTAAYLAQPQQQQWQQQQ